MRPHLAPSGRLIRNLRLRRGLSVNELAAKAAVDASAIRRIEREVRGARMTTLRRLAEALEVDVEAFLEDTSEGAA